MKLTHVKGQAPTPMHAQSLSETTETSSDSASASPKRARYKTLASGQQGVHWCRGQAHTPMHIGVSCRRQVGFSIIELILVIALTFTLGLLIFPISISLLRSQTLEETTELLAGVLRRAELQAMYEKHDSAFGVKVLEGSYVLFEGGSYADRNADEDEVFSLASSVALGGLDEVVFLKRTGTPDTDGLITLGLGNQQNVIDVNYAGTITY